VESENKYTINDGDEDKNEIRMMDSKENKMGT
jgi:hypothetical protein